MAADEMLFLMVIAVVQFFSCGGTVKHYLVAMNFKKRRLTIDGKVYLDNLCELVEVSSSLMHIITVVNHSV